MNEIKVFYPDVLMDENGNPIEYREEDTIDFIESGKEFSGATMEQVSKAKTRVNSIIKQIRDRKVGENV